MLGLGSLLNNMKGIINANAIVLHGVDWILVNSLR
jgi:hypothetical protein